MISQRIQWIASAAMALVLAGPVGAVKGENHPIGGVSFNLRSGARLATTHPANDERIHVRFAGEGRAHISADGVRLMLGPMIQRNGPGTLTLLPHGDFIRQGKSRIFVGHGTARVVSPGETTGFRNVRIVIQLRGQDGRLRLIGKFRSRSGPRVEGGVETPPDVLYGRFHGQRVVPEPGPA